MHWPIYPLHLLCQWWTFVKVMFQLLLDNLTSRNKKLMKNFISLALFIFLTTQSWHNFPFPKFSLKSSYTLSNHHSPLHACKILFRSHGRRKKWCSSFLQISPTLQTPFLVFSFPSVITFYGMPCFCFYLDLNNAMLLP